MILEAPFLALMNLIRDWIRQNLRRREEGNVGKKVVDVESSKVVREGNKLVESVRNIVAEEGENIKQIIGKVYKSIKRQ